MFWGLSAIHVLSIAYKLWYKNVGIIRNVIIHSCFNSWNYIIDYLFDLKMFKRFFYYYLRCKIFFARSFAYKKNEHVLIRLVSYSRLFNDALLFGSEMCFWSQTICLKLYAGLQKIADVHKKSRGIAPASVSNYDIFCLI